MTHSFPTRRSSDLLGIQIDKGARFTDWSRRPLDKRQIDYAIADVTHLAAIFPKMLAKLKKTGRGAWLDQEMERIADPAHTINEPDQSWKRVRITGSKPEALGRWKALARWRDLEAKGKDRRSEERGGGEGGVGKGEIRGE